MTDETAFAEEWETSFSQEGPIVRATVTRRSADETMFDCVSCRLDYSAVCGPESRLTCSDEVRGGSARRVRLKDVAGPVRAGGWMLFEWDGGDCVFIGIASRGLFRTELTWEDGAVTISFYGGGTPFDRGESRRLGELFLQGGSDADELIGAFAAGIRKTEQR